MGETTSTATGETIDLHHDGNAYAAVTEPTSLQSEMFPDDIRSGAAAFEQRFGNTAREFLKKERGGEAIGEAKEQDVLTAGQRANTIEDYTGHHLDLGTPTAAEVRERAVREVAEIESGVRQTQQQRAAEKADLVRQLRSFAQDQSELPYVQPEAAMAASVAQQLEAGAKVIDLTQRYGTSDSAAAEERHRDTLRNMAPALKVVAKHSERIKEGNGIAHGALSEKEIFAINQTSSVAWPMRRTGFESRVTISSMQCTSLSCRSAAKASEEVFKKWRSSGNKRGWAGRFRFAFRSGSFPPS